MITKLSNKTTLALALATALLLLAGAAFAGGNSNSHCYQIYDWATRTWKLVCYPW